MLSALEYLVHLLGRYSAWCRGGFSLALVMAALVVSTAAQEYLTLQVDEKGAKSLWGMAQQCAKTRPLTKPTRISSRSTSITTIFRQ